MEFTELELKYVIESDGSHHYEHEQKSKDKIRDNWLVQQGYKVLRCSNDNGIEANMSFLVGIIEQDIKDISDARKISKKRKLVSDDDFLSGDERVISKGYSESWTPEFFSKKGGSVQDIVPEDDLSFVQSVTKNL